MIEATSQTTNSLVAVWSHIIPVARTNHVEQSVCTYTCDKRTPHTFKWRSVILRGTGNTKFHYILFFYSHFSWKNFKPWNWHQNAECVFRRPTAEQNVKNISKFGSAKVFTIAILKFWAQQKSSKAGPSRWPLLIHLSHWIENEMECPFGPLYALHTSREMVFPSL